MDWYLKALKNYVNFEGRARRKEYWFFVLINAIVSTVLSILLLPLSWLYSVAVFLPSLAVTVRRLHDIGRSGWWILIGLIPIVGFIVLLVFMFTDSVDDNHYGPNPKAA